MSLNALFSVRINNNCMKICTYLSEGASHTSVTEQNRFFSI